MYSYIFGLTYASLEVLTIIILRMFAIKLIYCIEISISISMFLATIISVVVCKNKYISFPYWCPIITGMISSIGFIFYCINLANSGLNIY